MAFPAKCDGHVVGVRRARAAAPARDAVHALQAYQPVHLGHGVPRAVRKECPEAFRRAVQVFRRGSRWWGQRGLSRPHLGWNRWRCRSWRSRIAEQPELLDVEHGLDGRVVGGQLATGRGRGWCRRLLKRGCSHGQPSGHRVHCGAPEAVPGEARALADFGQ